jgi:D-alanyl-D-alanine carboxypeptidase (penicillin-binding protein 5/6)
LLLTFGILLSFCSLPAKAFAFTPPFTIQSESGIVLNLDTNMIIYEKNADKQQMPAHLAQIVTALVVLDACDDLDGTKITMSQNPMSYFYDYTNQEDVRYADIMTGDTFSVREYLYAMLLESSCESAEILADYFGDGNEVQFVKKMNEKAAEIGCVGTNFTNPTGLYDSYQITTARDMLKITQYALQNDTFKEIATTASYVPTSKNANHPASNSLKWTHTNTMMDETDQYYYKGAAGIKTGNLESYGRNIITMATKGDISYLLILMKAPFDDEDGELQYYHMEDATNLLDWAFKDFSYVTLVKNDEELAEVPVESAAGNDYVLVRPESDCITLWCTDVDTSAIQKNINLQENVHAPIEKGQQLGILELKFSGEVIDTVPLVSVSSVKRSTVKQNLNALREFPHSKMMLYSILVATALTLIYIARCANAAYQCRKKAIEEKSVHLIPKAVRIENNNQKNWKRSSDTVFYHRPDPSEQSQSQSTKSATKKNPQATQKPRTTTATTATTRKRSTSPSQKTMPKRSDTSYTRKK